MSGFSLFDSTGAVGVAVVAAAVGVAAAPAGADPASVDTVTSPSTAATVSTYSSPSAALAACPTSNPQDGQIVDSASISGGHGTVHLVYSPSARCVQAKVVANEAYGDNCRVPGGFTLVAEVRHNGAITASANCPVGGHKATTAWVNDAGIQQYAKGIFCVPAGCAQGNTIAF